MEKGSNSAGEHARVRLSQDVLRLRRWGMSVMDCGAAQGCGTQEGGSKAEQRTMPP